MKTKITIIACLLCLISFGQAGRLKKADNYYNHLAYSLALPIYEGLIGSEVDSPKLKSKLAYCYYQNSDPVKAEEMYRQMAFTPEATEDDYFYFAQALKQNQKYAESDQWLEKVKMKRQNDLRSDSYVANKNYLKDIEAQGIKFEIQHLKVNTSEADFGGYPTHDAKSVYFVSARKRSALIKRNWTWNGRRFLDLYQATPDQKELVNPNRMKRKVNSKFHEGPVAFSPNGKMVYFTRNNVAKRSIRKDKNGIQNLKMYSAPIDAEGKWGKESEVVFNSKDYSVGHPSVSLDGKTMYFASDMPGTLGGADIWKCAINADGTLGTPENMGKTVNTEGQEMFPWISPDGNLFYSSNGKVGLGGLDVFVCLPNGAGFNDPLNVGMPVNSTADDFSLSVNPDGKTGYFSSNRAGGSGDDDIYWFRQTAPFKKVLVLEGIALDKNTKLPLPNSEITLVAEDGTKKMVTADANGKYTFPIDENKKYTIEAKKDDYFDNSTKLSTENLDPKLTVVKKDIDLEKDPGIALYALVTDSKTNLPMDGVKMTFVENNPDKTSLIDVTTPATGDAMRGLAGKKVGDKVSYTINLSKPGYFPKTVQFDYVIKQPGIINVHEALAGALAMDQEVKDIRDLIQINDIRFDLNKDFIRPDAALELDKVAAVMNKYPNMVIELGSHTDCRSSYKYNEDLSDRRAKNSAKYIKGKITKPERIYGKGYGEYRLLNECKCELPVKSTCTNEQHDINRRTEFKIISIGSDKVDVINTSTQSFDKKPE